MIRKIVPILSVLIFMLVIVNHALAGGDKKVKTSYEPAIKLDYSICGFNESDEFRFIPIGSYDEPELVAEYCVSNTGKVPLSNVSIFDSMGFYPTYVSGDANEDGLLDTTESWNYIYRGTALEGHINCYATASGNWKGKFVSTTASSWYFGLIWGLDLEVLVNGVDADEPIGPIYNIGEEVTLSFVVTNNSNYNFTDSIVGGFGLGELDHIPSLAIGETHTLTLVKTVQAGQQGIRCMVEVYEYPLIDYDWVYYFGV